MATNEKHKVSQSSSGCHQSLIKDSNQTFENLNLKEKFKVLPDEIKDKDFLPRVLSTELSRILAWVLFGRSILHTHNRWHRQHQKLCPEPKVWYDKRKDKAASQWALGKKSRLWAGPLTDRRTVILVVSEPRSEHKWHFGQRFQSGLGTKESSLFFFTQEQGYVRERRTLVETCWRMLFCKPKNKTPLNFKFESMWEAEILFSCRLQ